jgi:hypothetical protein
VPSASYSGEEGVGSLAPKRMTGMSDIASSPVEEAHARVTQAGWLETVRETTVKAPLACLAVAFLLGIAVARRR